MLVCTIGLFLEPHVDLSRNQTIATQVHHHSVRGRLHWLAIQQRIEYKVCVRVYNSLYQAAPTYLAELCSPVSESANRFHLRSAARVTLQLRAPEQRDTATDVGPTLWNSLPLSVRDPSLTLTQFCARLKTVLFCRAYETLAQRLRDSLGCKDCCVNTNSLTYLLT